MEKKLEKFSFETELDSSRLIQAVEQSPETVVITDPEGCIEYVNPRFVELTGYSRDEVLGENPRILKSGCHQKEFYQNLWQTISSGQKWSGEFLNLKKSGEKFWEQASITPIIGRQGEISSYVAVKKDISQRKQMERELLEKKNQLEEKEKMLNDILDLSTEAIRYVDLNYQIIKSNQRYKELNRLYKKDSLGEDFFFSQRRNCSNAFCTENCGTENCSLKQILAGREFIQEDAAVEIAGETHFFIVTIVPYRDHQGNLKGIIQSYRDITARKNYEKTLELSNQKINDLYSRLEAEFEKGRRLHQQFLPKKLPQIAKLDYQVYFQPANKLGGDFYNLIDTGKELLIYLADVSGHGLDGSILNIFLRELVNNYLSNQANLGQGLNSTELLKFIINKYHQENIAVDYMTCLLIGVYSKEAETFAFSNAGIHIPPLLIDKEGKLNKLENGGVPISTAIALENYQDSSIIDYQEQKVSLKSGDLLFITTDGIIEERSAANDQQQYGLKRLTAVLEAERHSAAAEVIRAVNQDFKTHSNSRVGQDDITFMVFKQK
ncbi:PAS domain S-box-containing protein [Halanaerobium saccharolyticum]|uniref:PAS domain S-box-containing protein n=1 Tax=Halanaerobium saccharolyticum TaxID=43595 RepID=A0A4R6S1W9_9FIRM|nr:PAS domain S-box protein [Halanaerobium saccharolyticum]TDP93530.1 PAS domain S-box-containing protein [Halanaerobium saccharolyticum]